MDGVWAVSLKHFWWSVKIICHACKKIAGPQEFRVDVRNREWENGGQELVQLATGKEEGKSLINQELEKSRELERVLFAKTCSGWPSCLRGKTRTSLLGLTEPKGIVPTCS